MIRLFFEMIAFYQEVDRRIRISLALGFLGLGILLTTVGFIGHPSDEPRPAPVGGIVTEELLRERASQMSPAEYTLYTGLFFLGSGALLSLACGKTKMERSGYNF